MSTPAKVQTKIFKFGLGGFWSDINVRVPDRKKKKEGGGGLYEFSSQGTKQILKFGWNGFWSDINMYVFQTERRRRRRRLV